MVIRKATRKKAKAKIAIAGPSGSGKTYSALSIAFGLCSGKKEPKIGVIDTENASSELYAPVFDQYGGFFVLDLKPPYLVDNYINAIKQFENQDFDLIIIDTLSHAWAGTGGLLDKHTTLVNTGINNFYAWKEITPHQNRLIENILLSPCHIITTFRSKADYVIENSDGKTRILKVGTAPIFRDGIEYEFTIFFEMNQDHICRATKDRTGIFDQESFVPSTETGIRIKKFLEEAEDTITYYEQIISQANNLEELRTLWENNIAPVLRTLNAEERDKIVELKEQIKTKLTIMPSPLLV